MNLDSGSSALKTKNILIHFSVSYGEWSGVEEVSSRIQGKEWGNVKIRKSTYEQIKKLSDILGIKRYRIVDLSILILPLLMSESIVVSQEEMDEYEIKWWLKKNYDVCIRCRLSFCNIWKKTFTRTRIH